MANTLQQEKKKRIDALVNPDMLRWAREKCGFDINGAAKKINNVKPSKLLDWEDKNKEVHPTIRQAIKMAEVYKRPLSLFYLNEPPRDFSVAMTDFRYFAGIEPVKPSPALLWEQRHAVMRHEIALELSEIAETESPVYQSCSIKLEDAPENAAQKIRSWLGITWEMQRLWREPYKALNAWKEAIEQYEILIFHTDQQTGKIDEYEVGGFAISFPRFPVIILNVKKNSPRAPIFTLLHELIHLLLKSSGYCDLWEHHYPKTPQHREEVFCNRVAGSVLVPKALLLNHDLLKINRKMDQWNEFEIDQLSKDFVTSKEVIVRRLLINNKVSREFYEKKRTEYIKYYLAHKQKMKDERDDESGGPQPFRMALSRNGKFFTRLVLGAYYDKQISLVDVSDYLGTKIKHIKKIEDIVFGAKEMSVEV